MFVFVFLLLWLLLLCNCVWVGVGVSSVCVLWQTREERFAFDRKISQPQSGYSQVLVTNPWLYPTLLSPG